MRVLTRRDTPDPPGGGEGGAGGSGGEGTGPRAFATGYKPNSGDMMVYGGGALTVVGVLATAINGDPTFLLASVVGTLSAFYFVPTLDTRTPQLGANAQGLFVARYGVFPWDAIRTLTVRRRALRTMNLATLVIELDRPLPQALAEVDPVPLAQRYTARNARQKGETIEVTLHTLAMPVDAIEARLRALRHG